MNDYASNIITGQASYNDRTRFNTLYLSLDRKRHFVVTGGPIVEAPDEFIKVRMAKEIPSLADIVIPTRDYSTPTLTDMDRGLRHAVRYILAGRPVFVGCMGGKGRTGLFLAILAKAFGYMDPVSYVRSGYYKGAVETRPQEEFVEKYRVPYDVLQMIAKAQRSYRWKFWKKGNLTQF